MRRKRTAPIFGLKLEVCGVMLNEEFEYNPLGDDSVIVYSKFNDSKLSVQVAIKSNLIQADVVNIDDIELEYRFFTQKGLFGIIKVSGEDLTPDVATYNACGLPGLYEQWTTELPLDFDIDIESYSISSVVKS